ncbi:MAG: thioredoxin family protein [Gammaproteobacteria bacterium]|nr:thioredoxin family protein [Gammaproteobacteria bacterium]
MVANTTNIPPSVVMLLASGCSHCPAVLNQLCELLKSGEISQLTAINISQQPEAAQQYKIRSVPWLKIGDIELLGNHSKDELLRAIKQAGSSDGLIEYYDELLNNGQLNDAIELLKKQPDKLALLLEMLQHKEIKISVQIGIGAIMEEFAETDALLRLIPELIQLTKHELARVRNDACFYLSLTMHPSVIAAIQALLNDPDAEVQETAQECIENFRLSEK